jgi:hypothetical protein
MHSTSLGQRDNLSQIKNIYPAFGRQEKKPVLPATRHPGKKGPRLQPGHVKMIKVRGR